MAMAYLIEYLTEIQRSLPLFAIVKAIACIKIDKKSLLISLWISVKYSIR
jgi:hypothetical protein